MRVLTIVAALGMLLAWRGYEAHAAQQHTTSAELHARAARVTQVVERSKTVIRWFERHPAPLYSLSPRTKRLAWRTVNLARQRVILGRAELGRIRALIRRHRQVASPAIRHRAEWLCIHRHEGRWNDSGDPYWGGLQMDREFMADYGRDMIRKYGGHFADAWSPEDQMVVAERAYRERGFGPWPNTARACGLL